MAVFRQMQAGGLFPGIEDMRELARKHGGHCLSAEYVDMRTALRWQCDQGHTWDSRPDNVKAGSWCRICSRIKRQARWLEEMRTMAHARGGRCLSDTYVTSATKLRWQCGEGHVWEAMPASLRTSGSWCPVCGFEKLRLKIEDMHTIARERGGECLSTAYVNNETRLRWRCAHGHEWDAKPMHIRLGTWCPTCARPSYTIADMRTLARERGGECLSQEYVNNLTKLQWRCMRGHEWSTTLATILADHWCPECAWLDRSTKKHTRRKYEVAQITNTSSG